MVFDAGSSALRRSALTLIQVVVAYTPFAGCLKEGPFKTSATRMCARQRERPRKGGIRRRDRV